jgi:hypothetical protein
MRRRNRARTAAVVAVVAALALALLAPATHAQKSQQQDAISAQAAAPPTCPKYCDMCVRTRGHKVVSAETVVTSGREFWTGG